MSESKNEMILQVQDRDDGAMMLWPASSTQYMTSLGDSGDDIMLRVAAMSETESRLSDHAGKSITVRDWFIHRVTRVNAESGEVTTGRRCVLILTDGTMVTTSSQSAISTVGHLLSLRGFKRFDPPVEFHVGKQKGSSGHNYLTLRPVVKSKKG